MNLNDAQEMGEITISNFKLKIPFVIRDEIRMLGFCQFPSIGSPAELIGLQKRFVELNNPFVVMDTIFHEIAHAVVGQEPDHNQVWEAKYLSIGGMGVENVDKILIEETHVWNATCWWCQRVNTLEESVSPQEFNLCRSCQSKLPIDLWSKNSRQTRMCSINEIMNESPSDNATQQQITQSGSRLLQRALEFDKGLRKSSGTHLSGGFNEHVPAVAAMKSEISEIDGKENTAEVNTGQLKQSERKKREDISQIGHPRRCGSCEILVDLDDVQFELTLVYPSSLICPKCNRPFSGSADESRQDSGHLEQQEHTKSPTKTRRQRREDRAERVPTGQSMEASASSIFARGERQAERAAIEQPKSAINRDWILGGGLILAGVCGAAYLCFAILSADAVSRANAVVEWKIREAKTLIESGKLADALASADDAWRTPRATNINGALELREQLTVQLGQFLGRDKLALAKSLFTAGKFVQASGVLQEYATLPQQQEKEYAQQLLTACKHVSSDESGVKYLCELTDEEFDAVSIGRLPAAMTRLDDGCGDTVLNKLQSNVEGARGRRQRVEDFRKWVRARVFESREARRQFDSYFAGLMRVFEEECVTPTDRAELKIVRQIMNTHGYDAFASSYIAILNEVYTVDNYSTDREAELRRLLEVRRNDIFKSILNAVSAALPSR